MAFYLFEFDPNKKIVARIHQSTIDSRRIEEEAVKIIIPSMWNYFLFIVRESPNNQTIGNIYFFTTPDRLMDGSATIYKPLLPNLYPSGRICLGTQPLKATEPQDKIEEILSIVFQGDWNLDLFQEMSSTLNKMFDLHIRVLQGEYDRLERLKTPSNATETSKQQKENEVLRLELLDNRNNVKVKWYYAKAEEIYNIAVGAKGFEKKPNFGHRESFLDILENMGIFDKWIQKIIMSDDDDYQN